MDLVHMKVYQVASAIEVLYVVGGVFDSLYRSVDVFDCVYCGSDDR